MGMIRHLKESIVPRKTGMYEDEFPRDPNPSKDTVIRFLEGKGFQRIEFSRYVDFESKYLKSDSPVYTVGEFTSASSSWIRFGGGGDKPLFFWRLKTYSDRISFDMETPYDSKEFKTFEDFRSAVCSYFGWN